MRNLLFTLANIIPTFLYFIFVSGGYGALCGVIIGTAMLPAIGTFFGALIGFVIGMGIGCVLALAITPMNMLFFGPETDIQIYGRWLTRLVLAVSLIVGLIGGGMLIRKLSLVNYPFHPLVWVCILGGIGLAIIWMSLALAYMVSEYPEMIAGEIIQRQQTKNAETSVNEGSSMLDSYMSTFYNIPPMSLTAGLISALFCALVVLLIRNPSAPRDTTVSVVLGSAVFSFFIGIYSPAVFALYWVFGAGSLIRFLKRVILDDLWPDPDPETYRLTLCVISFVFTLLTTWWTFVLAPWLALHVARKLYTHDLTLPPNGYSKAKRKAKSDTHVSDDKPRTSHA